MKISSLWILILISIASCKQSMNSIENEQVLINEELNTQENESISVVISRSVEQAIFERRKLLEDTLSKINFKNLNLNNDITMIGKEPQTWDEFDKKGNFLCTQSWKIKKIVLFRERVTWEIETAERSKLHTCNEDFKPFVRVRGYETVDNNKFAEEFKRAAIETQEEIINGNLSRMNFYSNEISFFQVENGFLIKDKYGATNKGLKPLLHIVGQFIFSDFSEYDPISIKVGEVSNAYNIFEGYDNYLDIKRYEQNDLSREDKVNSCELIESPFVSYYSKPLSIINKTETSNCTSNDTDIELRDLLFAKGNL